MTFRLFALAACVLALGGCVAASVVGTTAGVATRAVSSTGDVIFDHDGDGK